MTDFVMSLILLLILVTPCLFIYKYRAQIKLWAKEPTYGDMRTWRPDRVKRAQREVVKAQWELEDEQGYLEYVRKLPVEETEKEVEES